MTEIDYRASHMDKGSDYDSELSDAPWERFMVTREANILESIVAEQFPDGVTCHLDFACGTGRAFETTRGAARRMVGIDVSASMLEAAKRKVPEAEFVLADVTRHGVQVPTADLVTAFRFFGNAEPELRHDALDFLRDAVAPGGLLVLDNHRNPRTIRHLVNRVLTTEHLESRPWARWDLTTSSLIRMVTSRGFDLVGLRGIGWWVLLSRWATDDRLRSRAGRVLERFGALQPIAHLSPVSILVARRHR